MRLPTIQGPIAALLAAVSLSAGCEQVAWNGPPAESCVECHDHDRSRAKVPDHLAAGFSTQCDSCHGQDGWQPATVDHGFLPLTGGHGVPCESCHDRDPLPRSCVGCHEEDRNSARSPDHLAGGWPTDCAACHDPEGWKPTSFEHSFPIDISTEPGIAHNRPCGTCHVDQADLKQFSCFVGCHQHNRPDMDTLHPTATFPDYEYSSTKCVGCHPRPFVD